MKLFGILVTVMIVWTSAVVLPARAQAIDPFLQLPFNADDLPGNLAVDLSDPLGSDGISSIFDHSGTGFGTKDGVISLYDGTRVTPDGGTKPEGCDKTSVQVCAFRLDRSIHGGFVYYDGHNGIDFSLAQNTEVVAAAEGTVQRVNHDSSKGGGFGRYVQILHNNGYTTLYAHLCEVLVSERNADGSPVRVLFGDPVGRSGNTGLSGISADDADGNDCDTTPSEVGAGESGYHLHFGVYSGTSLSSANAVDPFGENGSGQLWLMDAPGEKNVSVALIIDSSGSMSDNDRQGLRLIAAEYFVNRAEDGDKIAVVDFDSSARAWAELPIDNSPIDRQGLINAIRRVDSSGGTNLAAGLQEGYNQLLRDTSSNAKAAIFLTDGDGSYSDQAALYRAKGWPIFVIGLGPGVIQSRLEQIAANSGTDRDRGFYRLASTNADIQRIYEEIATWLQRQSTLGERQANVEQGQQVDFSVTVPPASAQLTFSLSWPGSEARMRLTSPSGQVFDANTNDPTVYHAFGPTYEILRIANAEPGVWTVTVFGIEMPPGGELVTLNVTADAQGSDTTAPDIVPSVSGTLGADGWYTSDVEIVWTITDHESPITDSTGCDSIIINEDVAEKAYVCSATSGGGISSSEVTVKRDSTKPVLTLPTVLTANSTSPGGSQVNFGSQLAVDNLTAQPIVTCHPQSGTAFRVGTTPVSCTATDEAGNSATGQFSVKVLSASEMIALLRAHVQGSVSKADARFQLMIQLNITQLYMRIGFDRVADRQLDRFITSVERLRGRQLPASLADDLIREAKQVQRAIGH